MFDLSVCRGHLTLEAREDGVIRVGIIDLVTSALRASVDPHECYAPAETHVQASAPFLHIRPRAGSHDPTGVLLVPFKNEGVLQLPGVSAGCAIDSLHRLGGVRGVGRLGRRYVMLEQTVVLVRHASDAAEDRALHEVVGIGAEAVDDIVVVPDVDLGNPSAGTLEGFMSIPPHVVPVVVVIAVSSQLVVEIMRPSLVRVGDVGPLPERAINPDAVIIDLVAAADHDMERSDRMKSENVVPQRWTSPALRVRPDGETITGIEHDAHRIAHGRYDKVPRRLDFVAIGVQEIRNGIFPARLVRRQRDGNRESPEHLFRIFVELDTTVDGTTLSRRITVGQDAIAAVRDRTCLAQVQHRLLLRRRCDDQNAPVPG